ncbi:Protein arginine N-methyltransferase 3 [Homalodisca vitripennis]|nr:Protein arginine N-methyltransferase 3 [Homalodisca vitripennis]
MECYSYIKLVNFIRSTNTSCDTIMSCDHPLWSDDKYMTPVNQEDPWLMFAFTLKKIMSSLNASKTTVGLFCDLSKAFDVVDHCIYLDKLETKRHPWTLAELILLIPCW